MTILKLPPRFWDDHYQRCAENPGERREIKVTKRYALVELDAEALEDLVSDAVYYGGKYAPDAFTWLNGIKASARATVRALEKQGIVAN